MAVDPARKPVRSGFNGFASERSGVEHPMRLPGYALRSVLLLTPAAENGLGGHSRKALAKTGQEALKRSRPIPFFYKEGATLPGSMRAPLCVLNQLTRLIGA